MLRCEDCIHGMYNYDKNYWENGMSCNVEDEEECEKLFEERKRTYD